METAWRRINLVADSANVMICVANNSCFCYSWQQLL